MKTIKIFTILTVLIFGLSGNQTVLQRGWLMPDFSVLDVPGKEITYLPADGLNLYDRPNGEHIARLNRDLRSRNYPQYLRNVFLSPRDRTPELLAWEAFKPLDNDCYAIPFVRQSDGFILLFDTLGPYHYWASVEEIHSQNFVLTNDEKKVEEPVQISAGRAGLIIPDFDKLPDLPHERYAYAPVNNGWPVYLEPGGKLWGKLSRFCPNARYTDGQFRMFILPNDDINKCIHITTDDLYHLSDDSYVIRYYDRKGDYVRIFDEAEFKNVWVKIEDITSQGFRLVDWTTYFIDARYSPAHSNGGLNLREGPYADAPVILTVRGEDMDIFLIGYDDGFCEGQWCKVRVEVHRENPCTTTISKEQNLLKEHVGWMKIIDDRGLPNIYINTKGC